MLYHEKLREAEQLFNKEQFSQRKLELEKLYRLPAQQYIQKGANASEAPEYVQALLAFLAKQYPEALNKSRAAEQNVSWHYESKKLQGDIFAAMGNEQSNVGNTATASELYETAKVAYLEAAMKGQSDPQIYDALCSVHASVQEMLIQQKGSSPETVFKEGANFCEKALQADSTDINANLIASKIYRDWAFYQNERGIDSSQMFEKSADFARAALKIDAESGLAHLALGNAYTTKANFALIQERNPIPFLDLAEPSLIKASQKMPEDHQLLSTLANNSLKRAQHYHGGGADPRPTLKKTIDLLRRATQLSPKNSKYFAMLGCAYSVKGDYESSVGLSCRASYEESIQLSKRSTTINTSYITPYIWMALSYLGLANDQIDRGENPSQALDEALQVYKKCLTLDTEQSYTHAGIGIVLWKKAHILQKDPSATLDESREAFRKALQLDSKTVITYALFAEVELVAARDAISRPKSPEPFFKESEQIVRACFSVNPDSGECLESLVSLHLLRAEYLVSLGQSAEREIRLGIKAADHALKVNPSNALVMVYRGKLLLLRSQSSSDSARQKAAQEAEASFDQAFKVKNTLRREYGKYWEEAKRLAQN